MDRTVVITIFALVYAGMMVGRVPGLSLDRTGVAVLGAIAMVAIGGLDLDEAWNAVDVPTLALLFGLMVISAQFRLGGFYTRATRLLENAPLSPPALLAALMLGAGALSAVLANDVVCLAAAPVLVAVCAGRGLDPRPFLIGLACAANAGSAATLIGNPQNILIGEVLELDFGAYARIAAVPTLLSLAVAWAVLALRARGRWHRAAPPRALDGTPFDAWQTLKASAVLVTLVALFLTGTGRREVIALACAGLLLTSRRTASRESLALVDWQLLLLFIGLFVVQGGLERTGAPAEALAGLEHAGIQPQRPEVLFAGTALLSNLVSNVPAVMLLLPAATTASAGPTLALASTLAGNLLLVGSIANLIVVEQAARSGVHVSWREHAAVGVPASLISLALAAVWLSIVSW